MTEVRTLDLNEASECLKFAQQFPEPIDILVNNGGQSMREFFEECEMPVLNRMMNINFYSGVALIKGFLPAFLQ